MNLRNRAHFLFWLQMMHHRLDQELSTDTKVVWHPFLPSLFSELSLAHTKVVRSPLTNPKVVGSSFTDPEIVRSPFAHTKPIRSSMSKYCSCKYIFQFHFQHNLTFFPLQNCKVIFSPCLQYYQAGRQAVTMCPNLRENSNKSLF